MMWQVSWYSTSLTLLVHLIIKDMKLVVMSYYPVFDFL